MVERQVRLPLGPAPQLPVRDEHEPPSADHPQLGEDVLLDLAACC